MASPIRAEIAPVTFDVDGRFALPGKLSLANGEVHIWFVRLLEISRHVDSFLKILAPDEVAKANGFFFENNRSEYILARGLLRHIVGCYVGFAPHLLQFCYSSHGKPALTSEWGGDHLAFNLSHARGVAVYAFANDRRVGVDLEYTNRRIEFDHIAERFFSSREVSLLRQLPSEKKPEAFFSCWTRKEAYIKARGEGLSVDLRSFDVLSTEGQPVSVAGDSNEAQQWSFTDLPAPAGYAAALVVEGTADRIQHWQWPAGSHSEIANGLDEK